MTPEQITRAIAKVDGWTFEYGFQAYQHAATKEWIVADQHGSRLNVPNYTTSYDAILPVLFKEFDKGGAGFALRFMNAVNGFMVWSSHVEINYLKMTMMTPLQLCEALLKALGLWEE